MEQEAAEQQQILQGQNELQFVEPEIGGSTNQNLFDCFTREVTKRGRYLDVQCTGIKDKYIFRVRISNTKFFLFLLVEPFCLNFIQ